MEAGIGGGCKAKAGWGCEHTGGWSHRWGRWQIRSGARQQSRTVADFVDKHLKDGEGGGGKVTRMCVLPVIHHVGVW